MNKEEFINNCKTELKIDITNKQMELLNKYYDLLVEWNNKFNLTTIIEYNDVLLKHFYDSLCLSLVTNLNRNIKICDMGVGAGFPGVVLKIIFGELNITLIESSNKKCTFLNEVIKTLELKNIKVECTRVEEYANKHLEEFDIVTTRAMSNMRIISELALPMLKIKGEFLPLKSHVEDEMKEANNIIELLGGKVKSVNVYNLPIENDLRSIPIIIKEKSSKKGFPRAYSRIIKDII